MNIALISVRGGSVRLPRKNIKELCGHPLLAWTIQQVFYSKLVDFVLFTTDDEEMYKAFSDYTPDDTNKRYHKILRPVYDNDTAVIRPYLEAVTVGINDYGFKDNDVLLTLFATSPQRHPWDIDNLIQAYDDSKHKYNQLAWFAPDRECFIYRNERPMAKQTGKVFGVEPVITDKFWNYSVMAGGTSCYNVGNAVKWWTEAGWSDRDIDAKMKDKDYAKADATLKGMGGYSVYPYQAIECDYDESFYVVEAIMEKYILKGRGIDIYRDYYEGHI